MVASPPCKAVFLRLTEQGEADSSKQRYGIATFGHEHSHPPWSIAGLTSQSKKLIEEAIRANPKITYRQLVSGKGVPGRSAAQGSLVRDDPASGNAGQVTNAMSRVKKKLGVTASESGTVAMIEQAISKLKESYVIPDLQLSRGPTPFVNCSTDKQLYAWCSPKMFVTQMMDFTFAESMDFDCLDIPGMDFNVGTHSMVMNLTRTYAKVTCVVWCGVVWCGVVRSGLWQMS